MENQISSTESEADGSLAEEAKKPMSAAERQSKKREKARLIKEGKYEMPSIDRAKTKLLTQADPDLKSVLADPEIRGSLTEADVAKLRVYVKNLRAKASKIKSSLTQIELQDISIKEKIKRISHK